MVKISPFQPRKFTARIQPEKLMNTTGVFKGYAFLFCQKVLLLCTCAQRFCKCLYCWLISVMFIFTFTERHLLVLALRHPHHTTSHRVTMAMSAMDHTRQAFYRRPVQEASYKHPVLGVFSGRPVLAVCSREKAQTAVLYKARRHLVSWIRVLTHHSIG